MRNVNRRNRDVGRRWHGARWMRRAEIAIPGRSRPGRRCSPAPALDALLRDTDRTVDEICCPFQHGEMIVALGELSRGRQTFS